MLEGPTLTQHDMLIVKEYFQFGLVEDKDALGGKFNSLTLFYDVEVKKW